MFQTYDVLLAIDELEKKALALPDEARYRNGTLGCVHLGFIGTNTFSQDCLDNNNLKACQVTRGVSLHYRPAVLLERHEKIEALQQRLMFEGTNDNSFLKLLTLKKGVKLLARSLPLFNKVLLQFCGWHFVFDKPQAPSPSTLIHNGSGPYISKPSLVRKVALRCCVTKPRFGFRQNQSSTLLLVVVQHVALLTKREMQRDLVASLELPIHRCLQACDLESLVVLSQTLTSQADNRADVAASTLQFEVSNHFHFVSLSKE